MKQVNLILRLYFKFYVRSYVLSKRLLSTCQRYQ